MGGWVTTTRKRGCFVDVPPTKARAFLQLQVAHYEMGRQTSQQHLENAPRHQRNVAGRFWRGKDPNNNQKNRNLKKIQTTSFLLRKICKVLISLPCRMATPFSNISILGICTRMLTHFSKRKIEIDLTWARWIRESSPQDVFATNYGLVQPSSCPMRRCCMILPHLCQLVSSKSKARKEAYVFIYIYIHTQKYMRFEMYITQLHTYKYLYKYIYYIMCFFQIFQVFRNQQFMYHPHHSISPRLPTPRCLRLHFHLLQTS